MIDHVEIDLTEAVEAAAKQIGNESGIDWDTTDPMMQVRLREMVIGPVRIAAPFIIQQALNDIASRTYDIK